MRNKKAMLLAEETLKILLAVIVVGFLVYFLVQLYFSKVDAEKLKEAENLLKSGTQGSFNGLLSLLNEGGSTSFQLRNPQGWYFFSFVGKDTKPNSCAGENCACICDKVWVDNFLGLFNERQVKECDESGTCFVVDTLKKFQAIKINKQDIIIKKLNGLIEVVE